MSETVEGRMEMSQREPDVLKVMSEVLGGRRTQREAARLLRLSVRQVRRIERRLRHYFSSVAVDDFPLGIR